MTDPTSPSWLDPVDVRAWLKLSPGVDEDLITRSAAAVEPFVERSRGDMWLIVIVADGETAVYKPDREVYQAAVNLAARWYRRRNSPAGIESIGDAGIAYVARFDPEIERALRIGSYRRAVIG
jgi:hypothetical protein